MLLKDDKLCSFFKAELLGSKQSVLPDFYHSDPLTEVDGVDE